VGGRTVSVSDDPYSDRIRCDHPAVGDKGETLGRALLARARERGRGRVVAMASEATAAGLRRVGFAVEGRMPGFYRGRGDCVVLGAYPDAQRGELAQPDRVAEVRRILHDKGGVRASAPEVDTRRATPADAPAIAELLGDTFAHYPTPSSDPAYVKQAIEGGVPFRLVTDGDEIESCASADLVRSAETAELTDCATRPAARGRGHMQAILGDLMDDLREMDYPTAFTLARASVPGVNLAFARLGFELRGTMPRSCRIGEGIEDMNIWSRPLDDASAQVLGATG
jgi:putative beta-lysine N-acetyltransferase